MTRELDQVLRTRFGLDAFKPWQREAIEAVLPVGGRALVVAPTGGGKSLTYQLPAAILPGTALVISPLVALMEDQVRALEARNIPATYLASTLDADVRRAREAWMRQGRYKLVYIAPERLAFDGILEQIARLDLSLFAIDEAHCIAQWGHDFRPDYLRLGDVIARLKPPRVLACTATATPEVRREIRERLNFSGPGFKEILRGFARPNLHLAARPVEGPTEVRKLVEAELTRALGSALRPQGGAIVYVATRKQTEQVADQLRSAGWNAAAYHAGMDGDARTRVADRFAKREVDVVAATNAFGMGIDRPDIRVVVHAQPPASIEAYYQEVGRAGRDGREAFGLLLCTGADIALRRRLVQLGEGGEPAPAAVVERAWRLFRDLLRYLDACTCRHDFVLRYFGDERELLGGCGHCDVCAELDEREVIAEDVERAEDATIVRMALSGVARARQRAGIQAVAEMLHGAVTARTERFGFTKLSTFGLLKDRSHEWIVALLRGCIAAGWVDLTPTEHPVPLVTPAGWEVMKGATTARFRLPRELRRAAKGRASRGAGAGAAAAARAREPHDPKVFERLRAFRAEVAKEKGVPAYVIALDRTLEELAARRPTRLDQLPEIYGLGPARIEAFGEGILKVLREAS